MAQLLHNASEEFISNEDVSEEVSLHKETYTVDLLIKDIDIISLWDIMDTIYAYKLKYSFNPDNKIHSNNMNHFHHMMKHIICKNETLPISIKPLVKHAVNTFQDYADDEHNKHHPFYEKLVNKGNQICYLK